MSYRVYIGHSLKDAELAKDLARRLAEAGIEAIFLPAETSASGQGREPSGMRAMIQKLVRESDEVIVLLTDNAADDYWLRYGMGVADSMDKRQTPVVVNPGVERLLPMVGKNFIKYADLPKYISSLKRRAKAA